MSDRFLPAQRRFVEGPALLRADSCVAIERQQRGYIGRARGEASSNVLRDAGRRRDISQGDLGGGRPLREARLVEGALVFRVRLALNYICLTGQTSQVKNLISLSY